MTTIRIKSNLRYKAERHILAPVQRANINNIKADQNKRITVLYSPPKRAAVTVFNGHTDSHTAILQIGTHSLNKFTQKIQTLGSEENCFIKTTHSSPMNCFTDSSKGMMKTKVSNLISNQIHNFHNLSPHELLYIQDYHLPFYLFVCTVKFNSVFTGLHKKK